MPTSAATSGPLRPIAIQSRDDLANAFRALRTSRDGLGLEQLDRLAKKINPAWALKRSTVSDFENPTKTTFPSTQALEAFLAVCGVGPKDRPAWHAALERARTAHLRRPSDAVRVRDADPSTLGVHAAIRITGRDPYLPPYAPRDFDADLHDLVEKLSKRGGLLVLVGDSSVGKSRSLLEALRSRAADWWLFHPEPGTRLEDLAASHPVRTVIWLDGIARYLTGTHPLRAAVVRKLIRAGALVVATIWSRDLDAISSSAGLASVLFTDAADASELLNMATVLSVPADFTGREREGARAIAFQDARLEEALEAGEPGVTQVLAAGPDLVRRWENAADPYGAAVITAVIDAFRLGVTVPITVEYLRMAVPGYLDSRERAEAPVDWLEQAVGYAVAKLRGAASALVPGGGEAMREVTGYLPADFLLHRGFNTRRAAVIPSQAWEALIVYADDPADLRRLALMAGNRSRYVYAERFLTKLVGLGMSSSARWLAELISTRSPRQAIEVLRPFADQPHIAGAVTDLYVKVSDLPALQAASEAGDLVASCRLIEIYADADIQRIHGAAARGDRLAVAWLADERSDDQHLKLLRQRAGAGDRLARGRLADMLAVNRQLDDAVALLTAAEQAGDRLAGHQRIDLQLRYGLTEEGLRVRAASGDEYAEHAIVIRPLRGGHTVGRIASALYDLGEHDLAIDVLCAHDDALVELTDEYLLDMLVACDRIHQIHEIAATGEPGSNVRLADLAAASGDLEELNRLGLAGNWFATQRLVDHMLETGQVESALPLLRDRASAGDDFARARLADLLSETGQEDELFQLALLDPWHASGIWAEHLAKTDRLGEAVVWLKAQRGPGADLAASQLASLLVDQDRLDEALDVLRPNTMYGDGPSVSLLVELLFKNRRIDDLRVEVNAGACYALDRLLDLLLMQGSLSKSEAEDVRSTGLTAGWPQDMSRP
jgi:hypothetical protein